MIKMALLNKPQKFQPQSTSCYGVTFFPQERENTQKILNIQRPLCGVISIFSGQWIQQTQKHSMQKKKIYGS